jgi:methylenetetrahydrofolate reductase (NADPH)
MREDFFKSRFRNAIADRDHFIYTVELVPGRGSHGKRQDELLLLAEQAARGGLVDALSITDNPGGHPTLSPDVIGLEVLKLGIEPIVHFTCKDKNRNQIESILYALDRLGIRNLLAMTGDYPLYGFQGKAKPVYDLDSVQLIRLIGRMNQGLDIDERAPGGGKGGPATDIMRGCAVSPFKRLESETMAQYFKLRKKIDEGADFVITQVGFDARKFHELLQFKKQSYFNIPLLGNIYILSLPVARVMNQKGVPGCVVTDKLYWEIEGESHSPDHGQSARLLRAAKLIALLKGMGYDGVHIGGPGLTYRDIEWVINTSTEFVGNWPSLVGEFSYPIEGGFYLYQRNRETALNTVNLSGKSSRGSAGFAYAVMRTLHRLAFAPAAPLYETLCSFFHRIDGSPLEKPLTELEYWVKFVTSRCRRCGDCTLAELAYLCPQSQCPKYLFNGQCGGSTDGWCEVFPGIRRCIYVRAYNRLSAYGDEQTLKNEYIRPRNWALDQTSSWTNYFLGRDHMMKTCEDKPRL